MVSVAIYLFSSFMEAIIVWRYSSALFLPKRSFRSKFSILCVLYILLFFISLSESTEWNALAYFGANFIFFITQFKSNLGSSFFHSSVILALMGMCEFITYGIFKYFIPSFLQGPRNYHELAVFAIVNKLLFLTVSYLITFIFSKGTKQLQQSGLSALMLMIMPLSSIYVMLTFISIGELTPIPSPYNWQIVLSAILLLISTIIIFAINEYTQRKNIEFTELQLLLQKESDTAKYYQMMNLQSENQRILIHDIKNHLHSIETLNENKENDKVSSYISQLLSSSNLQEVSRLCDHDMLNSILSRYMHQCRNCQIQLHADIRSGSIDFISDQDLTSLFCNLLDNAVEAATGIPDAYIEISTGKRPNTTLVVITMINSCSQKPSSNNKGLLLTSKSDKTLHGLGTKSIRKTVQKYGGECKMYYDESSHTFHTIITLKTDQQYA